MATHEIPRDLKGEGRILNIFSTKALIYTAIGIGVGSIFYFIFSSILGLTYVGVGLMLLVGVIGFCIATFKIPESNALEITRKAGGEKIDEVILRAIKFYKRKKRIYLYTNTKEVKK